MFGWQEGQWAFVFKLILQCYCTSWDVTSFSSSHWLMSLHTCPLSSLSQSPSNPHRLRTTPLETIKETVFPVIINRLHLISVRRIQSIYIVGFLSLLEHNGNYVQLSKIDKCIKISIYKSNRSNVELNCFVYLEVRGLIPPMWASFMWSHWKLTFQLMGFRGADGLMVTSSFDSLVSTFLPAMVLSYISLHRLCILSLL